MASKRILIVGGIAGGASCAARLRRLDEHAEIFIFERGPDVSFANCGLPYYIGGVIPDRQQLLIATPERFRDWFGVEVRTRHEVRKIDRVGQTIEVENLNTGEVSREWYDVLVLATGAAPVRPPLPGIELPGVFCVRNLEDIDRIDAWLRRREAERAVVVGAGFIGLEMVENFARRGMDVTVLEMLDQVMPPMDPEMVVPAHEELTRQGIDLRLKSRLTQIEPGPHNTLMLTAEGDERFTADVVIVAVGVRPDVYLAKESGLEIGSLGGIRVDDRMRTSDEHILAVGDAVEVRDWITGRPALIPLAGPANRQGRVAADVIAGRESSYRGTQGTSVVGIFDQTLAMTGATEKTLEAAGIAFEKIYTHSPHHVLYYPGAEPIAMKILCAPETGRLLGAQATGKAGVEKRIDVLAMAIQKEATVYDLEEAELCYAPQYGAAKDPVNMAGFAAANVLRGDVELVQWDDWQERRSNNVDMPLVLDVRQPDEVADGTVPDAINIPLGELRTRLDELPRDREIWVHCISGQKSYFASRILKQRGFRVRNLTGGFKSFKAVCLAADGTSAHGSAKPQAAREV
jgi:NADPH-dependent 2,4-dienoyl-CoA reductase/sulfur reductase-like enzyme/rhodanese-related sulfurtransferase